MQPNLFAHPDQLTKYSTISALHAKLGGDERIIARGRVATLQHVTSGDHEKGEFRELMEDFQECLINLSTRAYEVVALMAGGETTAVLDGRQVTKVDDLKIAMMENPRTAEHKDQHVKHPTKLFVRGVRASPISELPYTADARAVVGYAIDRFRHAVSEGFETVNFAEHIGTLHELLKRVHSANDVSDYELALEQLHAYVYTVSNEKMVKRLLEGTESKNVNFFDTVFTTFTEICNKYNVFVEDDIDEAPFLGKTPNASQLEHIQGYFAAIGRSEDAASAQGEAVYGKDGRWRFHQMLAGQLRDVHNALNAVQSATNFWDSERKIWTIPSAKETIDSIAQRVSDARNEVHALSVFLARFDGPENESVLLTHLKWIQKVCEITTRKTKSYPPRQPRSPSEDAAANASGSVDPSPKTTSQDQNLAYRPKPDTSKSAKTEVNEDESDDDDDPDPDPTDDATQELSEHMEVLHVDGTGWAWGLRKWLQLVCLHQTCLVNVTNFDPQKKSAQMQRLSKRISEAQITVVEIKRGSEENKRWPFRKLIEQLARDYPDLNQGSLESIIGKTYLERQKKWVGTNRKDKDDLKDSDRVLNREGPGGNYHCESSLLGLWAFTQNKEIMAQIKDEHIWLDNKSVFALKKDVLELVDTPLPILPVSKRSCPNCWILIQVILELGGLGNKEKKLVIPGRHKDWYAASLPPWLPKDLAEKCIAAAEKKLVKKLRKLQRAFEEKQRADQGHSSSGSAQSREGQAKHEGYGRAKANFASASKTGAVMTGARPGKRQQATSPTPGAHDFGSSSPAPEQPLAEHAAGAGSPPKRSNLGHEEDEG